MQIYIQSRNVVFQSSEGNKEKLELKTHDTINEYFGFEVPVLVNTPEGLQQIFDECPFSEEKEVNCYFTMLYTVPDKNLVEGVSQISYPNEEFIITESCNYYFCSVGYGNAKFNSNLLNEN